MMMMMMSCLVHMMWCPCVSVLYDFVAIPYFELITIRLAQSFSSSFLLSFS